MGDFNKQVVVCLASDLNETATAIANKERDGRTSAILRFGNWRGGLPTERLSEEENEDYHLGGPRSRLVIVAHGDPTSSGINGMATLTGKTLAEFVAKLLDSKIGRVTLHMCYGGGNIGTSAGMRDNPVLSRFQANPWNSIAHDFARHAGNLTYQVTARTDVVSGSFNATTKKEFKRTVGGSDTRKLGDKIVFLTDPASSPTKAGKPKALFATKAPAVVV